MEYYNNLILITLLIIVCMLVNISTNKFLNYQKRLYFSITYLLMFTCTSCECIGIMVNGCSEYKSILTLVKFLEFSLTPLMPVVFAKIFNTQFSKKCPSSFNVAFSLLAFHLLIEIVSIFQGWVFYISPEGYYHRGMFYFVYVAAFVLSALFLFYQIIKFSKFYQNRDFTFLIAIAILLVIGVSVQFMYSGVKTTWVSIVISSILVYIYYSNVALYTDSLTKLINQRGYQCQLELISETTMVILLDVDNFKSINDTFGHNFGDTVLKFIGNAIKETYHKHGFCYRIGGDEFCVLLKDYDKMDALNTKLIEKVEQQHLLDSRYPHISIGYSIYQPCNKTSILDTVNEADKNMYSYKNGSKQKRGKIFG